MLQHSVHLKPYVRSSSVVANKQELHGAVQNISLVLFPEREH